MIHIAAHRDLQLPGIPMFRRTRGDNAGFGTVRSNVACAEGETVAQQLTRDGVMIAPSPPGALSEELSK